MAQIVYVPKRHVTPVLYYPYFNYSLGLQVDANEDISSALDLSWIDFIGRLPSYNTAAVNFGVNPISGDPGVNASIDSSIFFRLFPRTYLVPSISAAGGWGTGTISGSSLRSMPDIGAEDKYKIYGGLDLIFPLWNGIDLEIFNLLIFRSLSSSVYFETEQTFVSSPALNAFNFHAGLQLALRVDTLLTALTQIGIPIVIGLDVSLNDLDQTDFFSFFISTSLPLYFYSLLLTY